MDRSVWLQRLRELDFELFTLGGAKFSVSSLLLLALLLLLLFWAAGLLRRWTVERVLTRTQLDLGTRQAVGAIVRYVVLAVGFVMILQNLGVNLTALSVLAGALGVGVGFGLQNIFSNFISGIIIMLERPIKEGDRVELAGIEGTVREIGARRTTVVTHDNVCILVPNQKFITDNVVNLVYTEAPLRLKVAVQIAAGTDPERVESLLLDAARDDPDVLADPAPKVLLPSLGGAAMSFELTVWHSARGTPRNQLASDLNFRISQRLRAHEIRNA